MSRRIDVNSAIASLLERPLRETSPEDLTLLFAGGAKRLEDWLLGLEIELLPFDLATRGAVDYPRLGAILTTLGADEGWTGEHERDGALIGLKGHGQIVSLEPGGQIELATRPYRALRELRAAVLGFVARLVEVSRGHGVGFWAMGYHPHHTVETTPKMPKARYDIMRAYFAANHPRGLEMMHLTGSVQCAVDFADERNMVDKIRTAARMSPFIAALTAASPFVAGRRGAFKSARYEVWLHTDPARSGLWPEMFDAEGASFRRYVEHALDAPAMFFVRDGGYRLPEPKPYRRFAEEGYEGETVTVADFVDHLTSMFPEIRTKSYIELRGADCAPPAEAVAIAGVWRAVLDHDETRREVDERLAAIDYAEVRRLVPAVATLGLEARSSIGPVGELARWIVERGHARMLRTAPDCAECLLPLVERAERGASPADDMIARADEAGLDAALALVELS